MKTRLGAAVDCNAGYWLGAENDRFLNGEGLVAASAKGVAGTVLHQGAVFAAHNLASISTH
jgi:hypothetical protein